MALVALALQGPFYVDSLNMMSFPSFHSRDRQ